MIPVWCRDERCGRPQDGPGHPRRGWVRVSITGTDAPPLWFCGELHAALALLGEAALTARPDTDVPRALARLNQLAGTYLTVLTATPERVRCAIERALAHVTADVDEWQRRQDRRRPTFTELSAELAEGRLADVERPDEGLDDSDDCRADAFA
jgi:hypothetical protein